jgi:DNA polymerase-3 subunit epsilon
MPDLAELNDEQTIAVVDVETTGLSPFHGDRVCEVGIVTAQGDTILDTYQTLVNPQRPISPGAARVNGLSDADVCLAPAFAEVAAQVLDRIESVVLVCHNAPFDLGFLSAEFAYLGHSWQPAGVIDTLDLARRHYHFPSNSLPAIASYLRLETPQAHRALADALTTFQVFRRFQRQLASQITSQSWDIADSYSPGTSRTSDIVLPPEIQEALSANMAIGITYLDAKGDETTRIITPLRVQSMNNRVYMVAFCHLRQAERNFRLDRILALRKLE